MKRVLAIYLLCLCSGLSFAQFDMSQLTLIQASPVIAMERTDVKKELKLNKDQEKAISKVGKEFYSSSKASKGNDMASLMSAMGATGRADESSKQVLDLLDEPQKARLLEIRIQMMGPGGLLSPEVVPLLQISDEQKDKAIQTAYFDDMMGSIRNARGKGYYDSQKKKRADADAKLLDVLTEPQKTKYKEIQGKPFKDARQKDPFF